MSSLVHKQTSILLIFVHIFTATLVESLFTWNFFNDILQQFENEPRNTIFLKPAYDFIVVGAGTAGCTMANRLTEEPSWDVLLVEAGGHEFFFMDIPLLATALPLTPANWGYRTEPSDDYCTGFKNRQCHFPRGKVVGGSSVLNYMIYTRGAPQDYDNWADMGNYGWSWEDVEPYFHKIENYNIDEFYDPRYHSKNGYLNIEYSPYRTNKSETWVKAGQEYGFKYGDYNGPDPSGVVSFLQLSMKNGTRHSASRAYLHPIKNRKNLHLSKYTFVTRLIYNPSKTSVIGVELIKYGLKLRIYAKKEVIVSAGAINSPKLLMLSGIGPREHLNSLKIPVVKNLPVGYNLMDHVATGGLQFTVDDVSDPLSFWSIISHYRETVTYYMDTHRGPLSVAGGTEAIIYTESNNMFNTTGWPDIELLFIGSGLNSIPILEYNFGFRRDIYEEAFGPLGHANTYMVFPMLMRPKSRGRITLRDTNPFSHPVIIPNYFEYEEDLDTIVKAIRLAIDLTNQPALKAIGAKVYDVPLEQCLEYGTFGTDEYFKCMTRTFTFTIYHQSGTCKMGPIYDPTSVVDSELRIHGIDNVRVVDASIMPMVTSVHINAAVYMIAENAADIIKRRWKRLQK